MLKNVSAIKRVVKKSRILPFFEGFWGLGGGGIKNNVHCLKGSVNFLGTLVCFLGIPLSTWNFLLILFFSFWICLFPTILKTPQMSLVKRKFEKKIKIFTKIITNQQMLLLLFKSFHRSLVLILKYTVYKF